jgi:microcystin-dependent protein
MRVDGEGKVVHPNEGPTETHVDAPNLSVSISISSQGNNELHNTMPPFVALYYCIKE